MGAPQLLLHSERLIALSGTSTHDSPGLDGNDESGADCVTPKSHQSEQKKFRKLGKLLGIIVIVAILTYYQIFNISFISTAAELVHLSHSSDDLGEPNYPRIWINVSSFGEGISKWRHSVPQLLGFAKLINATLVEPCMKGGRLISCNKGLSPPLSFVFSDVDSYMIPTTPIGVPLMATYNAFRAHLQHATSSELKFCLSLVGCVNKTKNIYFQTPMPFIHNISRYALGSDNLVLNIPAYWINAFQVNGSETIESEPAFNTFHHQHDEKVTEILDRAHITNDEFAIIQWRGEIANMDYVKCATEIVSSRRKMMSGSSNISLPFILMSSINQDLNSMWRGAKEMALQDASSFEALEMLKKKGFLKLDHLMTEDEKKSLKDHGILAVYELILAARSQRFATCTRRDCRGHACQKCNYRGGFSEYAIDYRQSKGKNASDTCWP